MQKATHQQYFAETARSQLYIFTYTLPLVLEITAYTLSFVVLSSYPWPSHDTDSSFLLPGTQRRILCKRVCKQIQVKVF